VLKRFTQVAKATTKNVPHVQLVKNSLLSTQFLMEKTKFEMHVFNCLILL